MKKSLTWLLSGMADEDARFHSGIAELGVNLGERPVKSGLRCLRLALQGPKGTRRAAGCRTKWNRLKSGASWARKKHNLTS